MIILLFFTYPHAVPNPKKLLYSHILDEKREACDFSIQKVFLSLHNVMIDPLMADGVSWRCCSYFSGPWQCNLLGSQWDSHKPPGFHPKYLKLCSEDEKVILWVCNDMGVSDKWQNYHFGVEYAYKSQRRDITVHILYCKHTFSQFRNYWEKQVLDTENLKTYIYFHVEIPSRFHK